MKLCAVIIETRAIENLEQIIKRHMEFLPKETELFIWVGESTFYLTKKFTNVTFKLIDDISIEGYNQLLTSSSFWSLYERFDRVLIFQSDSMILRRGVEEFLPYDYIGASWVWNTVHCGNGGFSLRNPKIMKRICEEFVWDGSTNEDHWICLNMYQNKIGNLAPIEIADRFSVEAKPILGSFAYHDISSWISEEECKQIKEQYN